LPISNEIVFSNMEKSYEYELFKCSKYNDNSYPKINSIFKSQPKNNNSIFEKINNALMDLINNSYLIIK